MTRIFNLPWLGWTAIPLGFVTPVVITPWQKKPLIVHTPINCFLESVIKINLDKNIFLENISGHESPSFFIINYYLNSISYVPDNLGPKIPVSQCSYWSNYENPHHQGWSWKLINELYRFHFPSSFSDIVQYNRCKCTKSLR